MQIRIGSKQSNRDTAEALRFGLEPGTIVAFRRAGGLKT
jgi:hypothetical protein